MGSPNCWPGLLAGVRAIVLHTMVGSLTSCDAEFGQSSSQVSAHYGVGLDGTVHQYVSLQAAAWANGILEQGNRWAPVFGADVNPNDMTVSIETEDDGDPVNTAVTDAQYASVLRLCREVVLPAWPSITHLVAHRAISPISRTCPGSRWMSGLPARFDELAGELGLVGLG